MTRKITPVNEAYDEIDEPIQVAGRLIYPNGKEIDADSGQTIIRPDGTVAAPVDNESVKTKSVGADEIVNNIGSAAIQASFDGLVVPVSPGLGMDAAKDPAATTTPISDARDEIVNNGSGSGAILYPPERVTEAATYTQTNDAISHIGWGTRVTYVEFTDLAADGYVWDGTKHVNFDGITVSGSDNANRTAGSAWRFITSAMTNWSVGVVGFQEWIDPLIHMDTGHLYSTTIEKLRGDISNTGRLLYSSDSLGPGFTCHNVRYSPGDASTVIQLGDGGGGNGISDVGAHFGDINVGGSAGVVLKAHTATNSLVSFDSIADFGDNGGVAKPHIVQFDTAGVVHSGYIRPTGMAPSYDYYIQLGPNNIRDAYISFVKHEGTLNNTVIDLQTSVVSSNAALYQGYASQVTNNSGAADGSTGLLCLADAAVEA